MYLGSARMRASGCLTHARRKFDEAKSSHPRLSAEALGLFQQLYDIEERARDFTPEARQALRQTEAMPLLAARSKTGPAASGSWTATARPA